MLLAVGIAIALTLNLNSWSETSVDTGVAIVQGGTSDFIGITELDGRQITEVMLTNDAGEPASLSAFRGQWVLVYFGFVNCPDICPTTLADFKQIKDALGDKAEQIVFVMVSVDGERDTPAVMETFLNRFDPEFVGFTAQPDAVRPLTDQFEVFFEKATTQGNYNIDHTPSSFLLDPEGRLRTEYAFGTERVVILEDLLAKIG
jgi:protein SCO1/2